MAPLDVVNARSQTSSDQQALIASQSNLEYQQLLMKQAIARNLDDPRIASALLFPPTASRWWKRRKSICRRRTWSARRKPTAPPSNRPF